jgi:hypothetical protein
MCLLRMSASVIKQKDEVKLRGYMTFMQSINAVFQLCQDVIISTVAFAVSTKLKVFYTSEKESACLT